MQPLNDINESLREHVGGHVVGLLVEQVHVVRTEPLMEPRHCNTVCPPEVPHYRVFARRADLDHSLIVFMELKNNRAIQESVPQLQPGHAFGTKRHVGGHNLGLRRTMRNA
jgi:hypothetical protein